MDYPEKTGETSVLNQQVSCYSDELQLLWEHGVRSWTYVTYVTYLNDNMHQKHMSTPAKPEPPSWLWWSFRNHQERVVLGCHVNFSGTGFRPWKIGKRPPLTRSGNCRRRGCVKNHQASDKVDDHCQLLYPFYYPLAKKTIERHHFE